MNYSTNDIYVIQLVNYLVSQADYQIVTVQQQKNDIWMVNAKHDTYPVIRLCSDPAGIMYDKDYIRQIHRAILDLIQREGTLLIPAMRLYGHPIFKYAFRSFKTARPFSAPRS